MEGNQKKMREALVALRNRFSNNVMAYQDRYFRFIGWHWHKKAAEAAKWRDVFQELREVCDAALSEPPRNCDLEECSSDEGMISAHEGFCESWHDNGKCCAMCPHNPMSPMMTCREKWLLAPAEKGGAE